MGMRITKSIASSPEENPFVAILGDIAEVIPNEMLIDERTKKLIYYYDILFEIF